MTINSTQVRDPLDTAVCLCRKIRKKAFVAEITEKQLFSIEQVREETTANTGCGCCYETVIDIIEEVKVSA
ncbi:(2Fe-2S)-binding protein [Amphritea sp. HPY]|uniref:(2Fe-2S)-binding protein n=1 Tax=Amphritea sp. HPY TaxID=3421652 RepID=UPI003D7D2A1E